MPIYIHKGDCTNFENENFIKFKITSDYDMSAWTFVVILGSIKKEIIGLTDNEFSVNYSAQETNSLNYGMQHFDIKIIDGNGCIKTVSNTIPVVVTNKVVPPLQEAITIDVVSIDETTIEVTIGSGSGTSNHAQLENLDYENSGHTGFAPASAIPTQTSQLTNNSGFITNAVNDLANYYLKSEVYTQAEILEIINNFTSLKIEIVDSLPTENISTSTFYLVPKEGQTENNIYDEYLYINDQWELIGSTAIDLTDYVKKTDYATSAVGGTIRLGSGTEMNNGILSATSINVDTYNNQGSGYFIGKGTLENVLADRFQTLTQSEYDALETKDSGTFYFITE